MYKPTEALKRSRSIKIFAAVFAAIVFVALMMSARITVHASPQHGFGTGQGRTDIVNANDYHTAAWERFSHNYQFTSGSDHRFDLGRPTQFNGFVPVDVHTVNFRRDANVSLRPPGYGIFSGNIPTEPSNRLFPQPTNPNFRAAESFSPNIDSRFDTLQQGTNAQPVGNPMNMQQNVSSGGFLPPTSVE